MSSVFSLALAFEFPFLPSSWLEFCNEIPSKRASWNLEGEVHWLLGKLFGCRLPHDSDLAAKVALSFAMALAKVVHSTCIDQHESNAAIIGRHSWSRRNNHLVCQSCICASIAQSLHDKCENIYENSQRKGSGTAHCPAGEMYHLDSLLRPKGKWSIVHYIKQIKVIL